MAGGPAGLTKVPIDGQPKSIVKDLEDMARTYIKVNRLLVAASILCMHCCNVMLVALYMLTTLHMLSGSDLEMTCTARSRAAHTWTLKLAELRPVFNAHAVFRRVSQGLS